jgi:outer membrane cobalamin receptor
MTKGLTLLLLVLLFHSAAAQVLCDSVHELPSVSVHATRIFSSETAGVKETIVDSIIFIQKVNLSLSDILSENTPVFIKNHGRGALATASFRGTAASHTRVSWNGLSINSPMAGMTDFSLIPVFIIDNITLQHGNASISEGSGGLGGNINISNRPDWNNRLKLSFQQGIGSYRTFDEYLTTGVGNTKLQWNSRYYHNYSLNNYTFLNRWIVHREDDKWVHPTDTNRNASWKRYGHLQELYWQPVKNQFVSLKWWSQWADRSIPRITSFEGPENASINNQTDTDHRVVADWNIYIPGGKVLFRSGFSRKDLDYYLKNYISGMGYAPAVYSVSRQNSWNNHISASHAINEKLFLQTSLDLNQHDVVSIDSVSTLGYNRQRNEYSGYMQMRYSPVSFANLRFMLRQDYIDNQLLGLQPFAGFDLKLPFNKEVVLKANIARNYNQPSLNELYWQPGGNPDLLPEKGFTIESGIHFLDQPGDNFKLEASATAFRADINNWILWLPNLKGYWEPINISRVLSQGLESHAGMTYIINEIQLRLQATYALNRTTSNGTQLAYIPLHSGNLFLHFSYKGNSVGWQHNSYSKRFTPTGWHYPYYMNDVSLDRSFKIGNSEWSAGMRILNVFNETYHSILYRPMPGRNFTFLIKASVNNPRNQKSP